MAREITLHTRHLVALVASLLIATSSASAQTVRDDGQEQKRQSVTTQYTRADRDRGGAGIVTQDEFAEFSTSGDRSSGKRARVASKTGSRVAATPNTDFWFYSADVVLFNDHDQDGYYHGIDLLFDADTVFNVAEVYAVVYLSLEGGPWNEYAATENFSIFGASSDDEYVIVTELVNGYPSGSYDILIELFDALDDTFVASYGPNDTSELAFLPLEDVDRDLAVTQPIVLHHGGGGGAMSWLPLLALLFVAWPTFSRRRPGSSKDLA